MRTSDFDYHLPTHLIAQHPVSPRDSSRLLLYRPRENKTIHTHFCHLDKYLPADTLLIMNQTRVIPARFWARKPTGARIEVLTLKQIAPDTLSAFCKPGKRLQENDEIITEPGNYRLKILEKGHEFILKILSPISLLSLLQNIGVMPLPPYIKRQPHDPDYRLDRKKYQTVFARKEGSVAAPTAGLHFTSRLLERLKEKGIDIAYLTLHVGAGTFLPVKTEDISRHTMHEEWLEIPPESARAVNQAWNKERPVIAVGTTCVRALETAASEKGVIQPYKGVTDLMIVPGYEFKAINGLITNFHLPRSTLLMLVCAFAGKNTVMRLYQKAVDKKYRFYSYGDAMAVF